MKVLRNIVFSLFLSLFAFNLFADGIPPSEESVCDPLQAPGLPGGLFGLCNAYCEAKDCDSQGAEEDQPRSCQNLLRNFRNLAEGYLDPPDPPCLESEPEPELPPPCACWMDDVGNNGIPDRLELGNPAPLPADNCTIDGGGLFGFDEAVFDDGFDIITFLVDDEFVDLGFGACIYFNSLTGEFVPLLGLTAGELADCQLGVYYIQENYHLAEEPPVLCNVIE